MDGNRLRISLALPGSSLSGDDGKCGQTAIETLVAQDGQFAFGNVQPTAMFGSRVKFELAGDAARFGCWEGRVQRGELVGVEIVQHDTNDFGVGVAFVDEPLHLVRKVGGCAPLGDRDMAPASQWLDHHKHIASAVAAVFVIDFARSSRRGWNRLARMVVQLQRPLVETYDWSTRVVALGVEVEDVLHGRHEVWTYFRNAPVFLEPWLEAVFLSVRRTASSEIDGTTRRTISSSASSCMVHEVRPSGGLLHAKAISVAWPRSSSLGAAPGRGLSLSAASSPYSTKRRRMRSTVERLVCSAAATSSSVRSSAANSKTRARVIRRADVLPLWTSDRNSRRCSSVRSTIHFHFCTAGALPRRRNASLPAGPYLVNINVVIH